jgi:hypothetical protein
LEKPWFKKKVHGYGLYPSNWKGWCLTVVLLLLTILLVLIFEDHPGYFAISFVTILVLYIVIAIKTGEIF